MKTNNVALQSKSRLLQTNAAVLTLPLLLSRKKITRHIHYCCLYNNSLIMTQKRKQLSGIYHYIRKTPTKDREKHSSVI